MKNTKKIGLGLLPLIAFIGFFFVQSRSAAAFVATSAQQVQDATFQFVDRGLIKATIGGQEVDFVDGKPFDPGVSFSAQNYDCSATIDPPDTMFALTNLGSYPGSLPTKYIHIKYDDGSGSGCQDGSVKTAPTGADVGMRTWFDWADSATIKRIDGGATFTKSPSADYYLDEGEAGKSCQDRIFVSGDSGQYFQLDSDQGLSASSTNAKNMSLSGCRIYGYDFLEFNMVPSTSAFNSAFAHSFTIGTPDNKAKSAGSSVAAQSASGDDTPSCESNFNTGFEWILCPALRIADDAAGAFNGFVEGQLNVCTGVSSTTGQPCADNNLTDQVKKVWSIFRLLSSLGLVVALLIMVISEALGFGMFDAYTIRKTLPKIVIAVILIQLSWIMFKFFIDLSNDLGTGIRDIMLAPFGGTNAVSLDKLVGHKVHASTGSGGGADAFSVFALLAGGIVGWVVLPGIIPLAFTAVFALLTAFVTLIFRKLVIIALVVLSPVALICWILPGLDKYWKMWLTNYEKLLLMFPMIMALIAGGRMFAYITSGNQAGGVSSFAELAIVVVAYFGPYFLLPKTYAWGGQFMQMGANAIKSGIDKAKAKPMEYAKNRADGWREARREASKIRYARKEGFGKNPLKNMAVVGDRFRSGQWDPLYGRPGSKRREKATTAYKAGGASAEEEELKNAKLSNEIEYGEIAEADREDYVRAKANGQIAKVVDGRLVATRDANGEVIRDENGDIVYETDRAATLMERRAALDKLTTLGGEGNFERIQRIHNEIIREALGPNATKESREAERMVGKFKDSNAQTLFKKLPYLYKNYDYAEEFSGVDAQGNPVRNPNHHDVSRTINGFNPEDITGLTGIGIRTLISETQQRVTDLQGSQTARVAAAQSALATAQAEGASQERIDTLKSRVQAEQNAARSAQGDLARIVEVYTEAIQDENLRGHIGAEVNKEVKKLIDSGGVGGLGVDAQVSIIQQRVSDQGVVRATVQATTPGPGTNIPAGGVTIQHDTAPTRMPAGTIDRDTISRMGDENVQRWVESGDRGWGSLADQDLMAVYNTTRGQTQARARTELENRGAIGPTNGGPNLPG